MLKNIKSTFFFRLMFSYIEEIQKLKLIRRNKSLQNNLNISIINYIFASRRHIVYESNGQGIESDICGNSGLIFKGYFLNGERNGKGKEYENHKLRFEGEYLNGKRNGKGKEYNKDGKLIFDGEYLYNFKLKGKLYQNEKLEYEGEYLCDREWNGKAYDENGNIIYELVNGALKGKVYYENGEIIFKFNN